MEIMDEQSLLKQVVKSELSVYHGQVVEPQLIEALSIEIAKTYRQLKQVSEDGKYVDWI